jgi:hypothetical protein
MEDLHMGEKFTVAKRFNIGIDVDGVLAGFVPAARKLCQELFDGRPSNDLIQTTWAFDSLGISREEEGILWKKIDSIPNWWLNQEEPLPDTDFLPVLVGEHRCVFITNRKDGTGLPIEIQTQQWLIKHFNLENPNVIISDKKGPVADGLKLDFYIDDRPKNVLEVIESAPKCETYLYHATYNTECEVERMFGFDMFAKYILRKGVESE